MGIINKIFGGGKIEAKAHEPEIITTFSEELSTFMRFGAHKAVSPASALSLYEQSTAVSIPINWIAELFASITPVVEENGEIKREHAVLDLLNKPSPYYTRELLLETMAKDFLVTKETYLIGVGNINRPPLELQPISPRVTDIPEGKYGFPDSIGISGNTFAGRYIPNIKQNNLRYLNGNLLETKLIRGYSTRNNSLLRGQSPLLQASAEIRQHILGAGHNVALLENGGRLSLIFHFDQNQDVEQFEETKRRVYSQYGGANNAGKIGVTAGGKLAIHEAGTNNKDMDFANLQMMAKIAVALQYRFPLPLITIEASTMSNYKESKLALYDDAVLPLADRLFNGLTDFLMPRFGEDPSKIRITYDIDQITSLASRRIDELVKRAQLGVETDNEIRSIMGREPYDGGDVILKPANLVPAGSDLFLERTSNLSPALLRDKDV